MRERIQAKLTYANVMVTILAFIVLGGGAYAAGHLGKNTVGTKQLKKGSVTTAKIKKNAVTGAKVKKQTLTGSDINLKKLGTVPSAETANTVPPRENIHLVGAPNEPPFAPGASNYLSFLPGANFPPVGFFKDHDDVVHLEGVAKVEEEIVFTLPPGFRPASGTAQLYLIGKENQILVLGSNVVSGGKDVSGVVISSEVGALLSGITFRAES